MGLGVYALTLFAGLYVKHVVARMTSIYGPFAATIGLLAYVSLLVQLFVIATEVNVVRVQDLWPRSLTNRELGDADSRAIELTMRRERLLAPDEPAKRAIYRAGARTSVARWSRSTPSTMKTVLAEFSVRSGRMAR